MQEEKLFPRRPMSPLLSQVAEDVWLLRGDIKQGMNVYFIKDGDGVLQFDAATEPMTKAVRKAAAKLGPVRRIVLGHSHTDHRGTASHLAAPVLCHPDEVRY